MNADQYAAPSAEGGIAATMKLIAVWGGVLLGKVGIHTWSDIAAFMAAAYSGLLIIGWVWRRVARARLGKPAEPDTDRGGL